VTDGTGVVLLWQAILSTGKMDLSPVLSIRQNGVLLVFLTRTARGKKYGAASLDGALPGFPRICCCVEHWFDGFSRKDLFS
jgi:hypothetical protein